MKTVNYNLGGRVVEIERDDYDAIVDLAYLITLERFAGDEGCWDYNERFEEAWGNEIDSQIESQYKQMFSASYVETFDCLLEGVFVPDMTDRMQNKSMQQRFRDMEPDVFDSVVSQAQLDEWIYC